MKRTLLILFFLLQTVSYLQAQLILVPSSHVTKIEYPNTKSVIYNQIPFVDDFSNYEGVPNPDKWQFGNAIVNSNYQFNPPTIGVVTLDAIDIYGNLYPGATTSSFAADTLESNSVRLDSIISPTRQKLSKSDSIYFSFYVQPGGGSGQPWETIGTTPSSSDSIILDFYSETDGWQKVWAMGGEPLDSLFEKEGAYYKYVLIPITEDKYFTKEFRFRFRNIASLNNNPQLAYVGNCDQWNIDYVYINKNRSINDTTLKELSFVDSAPSMLKRYQSMPANQYIQTEILDSLQIKIVNLYSEPLSSTYKYYIKDDLGNNVKMTDLIKSNLIYSTKLLKNYDTKRALIITKNEQIINSYENKLKTYLIKVSNKELSEEMSNDIARLLLTINDFKQIQAIATNVFKIVFIVIFFLYSFKH